MSDDKNTSDAVFRVRAVVVSLAMPTCPLKLQMQEMC
jgi:hypothetical protein